MKKLRHNKGFTLVELLAVLIIIAILAAVSAPIYMHYVKSARAADAQTTISAIVTANKIYMQKFQKYAGAVEDLEKEKLLEVEPAIKLNWDFNIAAGGQTFSSVTAVSLEHMPAGAGHQITYNVLEGEFHGWGIDE